MTVHKLHDNPTIDKLFEIESDISDLKIWAKAVQHAVMDAGTGTGEERDYRDGLALLLAKLVRDKAAALWEKYHAAC